MKKTQIFLLIALAFAVALTALTACENNTPTAGVEYQLSPDKTFAEVVGYDGTETNIKIGNTYEGVPVTSIGEGAFSECTSLTSITIPNSVTSIGNWAFGYCENLTSITIPDSATGIGNCAFFGCDNLASVTIPDSVTSIGYDAFGRCENLVNIIVDSENTAYSSDNGVLFNKNKTQIVHYPEGKPDTTYTIPDSVTSIGNGAFLCCDNLASVTIPDSVTSIGVRAFSECTRLTSITILDSVTSIGEGAFYGCEMLKNVYYSGSEDDWNKISKSEIGSDVTIHYNYIPN